MFGLFFSNITITINVNKIDIFAFFSKLKPFSLKIKYKNFLFL